MSQLVRYFCFPMLAFATCAALAQTCPNRIQLDDLYCDADNDMVADPPC